MELGPYELVEEIGAGAMGRVFAARDRRNGRLVAIKALAPDASSDDLFSIKREFRIARSLSSPHLVPIYDLFVENSCSYISMALLRGQTLDAWARDTDWRGEPARLGHVLVGALSGLVALHDAGLVHRDIKPRNIIVQADGQADGQAVLVDYGLATGTGASSFVTSNPNALAGTLGYLGPEALSAVDPSPALDLFALGATLYELITGALPPRCALSWQVTEDALDDAARAAWPDAPPPIRELVAATLRNDPARRCTAAQALAIATRLGQPGSHAPRPASGPSALIGRDRELAELAALLGPDARIAVLGPSGIGKTSLVARALGDLRARQPASLVLAGRCHPGEHVRYRVFDGLVDELSRWLLRLGPADRARLLPDETGLLRQTFPVLDRVLPAPAAAAMPDDPGERRQRLPAALATLLAGVHARWPLTLWVDDVHWADDDGLQLLRELCQALNTGGPAVVLSGRTLPAAVAGLCSAELAVPPLSEPDAEALVAQRRRGRGQGGAPLGDGLRAAVGNPGLLCFLVDYQPAAPRGTPPALADAVGDQLHALGPGAVELATVMSLSGEPLPMSVVDRVCRVDTARDDLHRLEHLGLIRRVPFRSVEALEIAHDALREAICDHGAGQDTSAMHRRLASELSHVVEIPREVIAAHWSAAGDAARAGELWLAAGREAIDALAFDHAVRCLQHSLQHGGPELRLPALREQARALSYAGQLRRAAELYLAAAALAHGDDRRELLGQTAVHFLLAGEIPAGMDLVRELFEPFGVRLPRHRAAVLAALIHQRLRARRWRDVATPLHATPVEPHASLADLAYATTTSLSKADLALGAYVQSLHFVHSMRSGSRDRIARGLALEAAFHVLGGGDERTARKMMAEASAVLGGQEPPRIRALFLIAEAVLAWTTGRWRACIEHTTHAERIAREQCAGAWWEINISRAVHQDALRWSGRYAELAPLADDSLADAHRRGDRFGQVTFRIRFATTLHLLGDRPDAAWRDCDACRDWPSRDLHLQHLSEFHSRAECMLYRGDTAAALAFAEQRVRDMRWAALLRATAPRLKVFHQLAACRLAEAAHAHGRARDRLIGNARRAIARVRRAPWSYAGLLADLVTATADHLEGRPVGATLAGLAERARTLDMPHYAEAIAVFQPAADRAAAGSALHARGAVDPVRWAAVLLPGLVHAPPH
ncbi:MAG TPA: protein kinase [Kofleriaceae bacterium]|nr:protein kinase [Kofleriaceae bacterium]